MTILFFKEAKPAGFFARIFSARAFSIAIQEVSIRLNVPLVFQQKSLHIILERKTHFNDFSLNKISFVRHFIHIQKTQCRFEINGKRVIEFMYLLGLTCALRESKQSDLFCSIIAMPLQSDSLSLRLVTRARAKRNVDPLLVK